jgi:2-dehydro-3-deoxyphosphooctonate aldolase (KDO 8-P synthase)
VDPDSGGVAPQREVVITPDVIVGNERPLTLFGGVNVLETDSINFAVAEHLCNVTRALGVPLVFKASFDKANRTSISSYRGPSLDAALEVLQKIKKRFQVPILTDVHEPHQAAALADFVDVLQIPAMLSRQTDLIAAVCATRRPVLLKKMQTLAPEEMEFMVEKCLHFGNEQLILCERGTAFGYRNLVVDPLSFPTMKRFGFPVAFDVTHSLQLPGGLGSRSGGRSQYVEPLAVAGVSQGIAAVFIECHPDPENAKCDGPSALPLASIERVLSRLRILDGFVKSGLY